jgi:hypothetical protein
MRRTSVERPCQQCGRQMTVKLCLLARKKYCSRRCLGLARISHLLAIRKAPTANSGSFKLGDNRGEANSKWIPAVELRCEECGQPFALKPWVLRVREKHNGHVRFCSRACLHAHRRKEIGPLSHNWNGNANLIMDRYWRQRRLATIELQHGKCARCHEVCGNRLQVHHLNPRRRGQNPYYAHRAANLLGLCRRCHGSITAHPVALAVQHQWRTTVMSA